MSKRKRSKRNHSKEGMDRVKCGHCYIFLSRRQYHEHKRQFYDTITGKWKTVEEFARLDACNQELSSSEGVLCTV